MFASKFISMIHLGELDDVTQTARRNLATPKVLYQLLLILHAGSKNPLRNWSRMALIYYISRRAVNGGNQIDLTTTLGWPYRFNT